MSTYLSRHLEQDMTKNAERQRARAYKGEVATPRTFVKDATYSGAELRMHWRKTIWDDVPSLMGGLRHYKCS